MDTLTTCNACGAAPMAPGQEAPGMPGYCAECLDDTAEERHCRNGITIAGRHIACDDDATLYGIAHPRS